MKNYNDHLKMKYIEGIRGVMAINVLLCHFVCVYYPAAYFASYARKEESFISYFATTGLSCLVNGNVAVLFFFIISGYFTAISVFKNKNKLLTTVKNIILRYLRLMPVVFFSTIFAFFLMKFKLMYNLKIAMNVGNPEFLLEYCNFYPTIKSAIYNGLIKSFISGNDYNGPFWTIRFEFWGFIFVSIIANLFKEKKWRRFIYIICVILICLFHVYYSFFIIGLIIADLRYYPENDATVFSKYYIGLLKKRIFLLIITIIGSFFFSFPMAPIYGIYKILDKIPIINGAVFRGIGVACLLWVIFNVKLFQKFFENKTFCWIGKYSFLIYAIHWPVMLSLEAFLFSKLLNKIGYDYAAMISFGLTFPSIIIISIVMWYFLEKPRYDKKILSFIEKIKLHN